MMMLNKREAIQLLLDGVTDKNKKFVDDLILQIGNMSNDTKFMESAINKYLIDTHSLDETKKKNNTEFINFNQNCFHCNQPFSNPNEILSYRDHNRFPKDKEHYSGIHLGICFRFVCKSCKTIEDAWFFERLNKRNENESKYLVTKQELIERIESIEKRLSEIEKRICL